MKFLLTALIALSAYGAMACDSVELLDSSCHNAKITYKCTETTVYVYGDYIEKKLGKAQVNPAEKKLTKQFKSYKECDETVAFYDKHNRLPNTFDKVIKVFKKEGGKFVRSLGDAEYPRGPKL